MNRLIKKIIIHSLASHTVSSIAMRLMENQVTIFLIHQLVNDTRTNPGITPGHLRNCLNYLINNGYSFISLIDIIQTIKNGRPLPEKAVAFTMDDGFMDQATVAVPIFLEYGCPLTFFVITDLLDQKQWPWDAKISWIINNSAKQYLDIKFEDDILRLNISNTLEKQNARHIARDYIKETGFDDITETINKVALAADIELPEAPPYPYEAMNWNIARELESKGVSFAPHSKSHRILSKINPDSARNEIEGSWLRLKDELKDPLKIFCYPTGRIFDFGPREIGLLKQNNFIGAVSTIPGHVKSGTHLEDIIFRLPRLSLPRNMTDFIKHCHWFDHLW